MKRLLVIALVLLVAVAISKPLLASDALKIGTVDLGRALNEVGEGKKAKANLESEFKTKKGQLDSMKNEIAALREELEKKSALLSQDALKEKHDNFQRKFMEYQQKAKEYTEELARKEGEMTSKIIGKLRTVVESIAQRDGYTFVLERSQGGVVYGPSSSDITDKVIGQYGK